MCNIAPAGVAPAATPVSAGGPTGTPQLSTDGVTPIPSILQPTTDVGGVSGGGPTGTPEIQAALEAVHGAIGSLNGALQAIQGGGAVGTPPVTGGGAGGCGCGQVTQGPEQLGGANAAPDAVQNDKPDAPKPEAPKPAAPVAPSTAPAGTKLSNPLPGSHVTSHFGEVADIRGGVPHSGTDYSMGGAMHKPVLAAAPGKVVSVDFGVKGDTGGSGGGNIITIDHGNGFQTRYMHMAGTKGPNVKVGDTVNAGQQIGSVGSTGNSTGAHLHFMVIKDGKNQNAEPYVNGEKTF